VRKPDPLFLIIMGAVTAFGLPFALAFPRTLVEKLLAVLALVLVSAAIAALVMTLKKGQRNQ
jgi:hypothetical protein